MTGISRRAFGKLLAAVGVGGTAAAAARTEPAAGPPALLCDVDEGKLLKSVKSQPQGVIQRADAAFRAETYREAMFQSEGYIERGQVVWIDTNTCGTMETRSGRWAHEAGMFGIARHDASPGEVVTVVLSGTTRANFGDVLRMTDGNPDAGAPLTVHGRELGYHHGLSYVTFNGVLG